MRKILKTLGITLALALTFPTAASGAIYDGGGGTSGGGTGSASYKYHWDVGYGDSLHNFAYNQKGLKSDLSTVPWATHPVWKDSKYDGQRGRGIIQAVSDMQPECARSDVQAVFGMQYISNQYGWKQLVKNVSPKNYPAGYTYGTLLETYKKNGGSDPEVIRQLEEKKSVPLDSSKSVYCVTTDAQTRWVDTPVYEKATESAEVSCEYSRSITVSRQLSALDENPNSPTYGQLVDPIGKNNLHNQPTVSTKTIFGLTVDRYLKEGAPSPEQAKAELETACLSSKVQPRHTLDLSAGNKEGLAEGGILNVKEATRYATYKSSQSSDQLKSCTAFEEQSIDGGKTWTRTGNTRDCASNPPAEKNFSGIDQKAQIEQTPKPTGFWQMLGVHCNADEFKQLEQATEGIEVADSGDSTSTLSAVAYTQTYREVPEHLDFGDETHPNPINRRTSELGFYDKECPFECTPDPKGPGASTANGATSNQRDKPVVEGGKVDKYGAVSENLNHNEFQYFRDNEKKPISLDVWYPKQAGVVQYDGSAPLTTTITRWAEGTPSTEGLSGGKFTMKSKDGKEIFGSEQAKTQRNWEIGREFHTPVSGLLHGLHRDFTVQSTWASDADKPQILNVGWEYKVPTATQFSSVEVGFDDFGNAKRGAAEKVTVPIEGKCYAAFGTDVNPDTVGVLGASTGTGADSKLSNELLSPSDSISDPSNLIVKFVRSTTE